MEEVWIGLMLVGDVIADEFVVGFVVEKDLSRTGWLNQSMLIVRVVETRMGTVGDRHALCIVDEFVGRRRIGHLGTRGWPGLNDSG